MKTTNTHTHIHIQKPSVRIAGVSTEIQTEHSKIQVQVFTRKLTSSLLL
jgi:hypothetical protein